MTPRMPDHEVHGDGDTTLFLLHGAYGSKEYFRDLTAALVGAGLRVVAWDAPGYGLSPLPPGGLQIPAMAEAAARLVEREASATNVVLGHSMGGIIAPAVCNLLPGRLHGLVISATVSSFSQKSEEDKRTFLAERIDPLQAGHSFFDTARAVVDSMFAPTSAGPRVDQVKRVALGMRKETFIAAISAIVHYEGVPALRALRLPTLLVAGAHDKVGRPEGMRKLVDLIPDARFVCIDGAGHYAFAEQQDVFVGHVVGFVREVAQRHATARDGLTG